MAERKTNIEEKGKNTGKCIDKKCPFHGNLKVRGRQFRGHVIKKFPKRIVIEFQRIVPVKKYERYLKKKTKIHARLPDCQKDKVNVGDYVLVQEIRPLSKLIHHTYIMKVKKQGLETEKAKSKEKEK